MGQTLTIDKYRCLGGMEPEWLVNSQGLTLFYTLASIHDSVLQRPKHGLQIQTFKLSLSVTELHSVI